MVASYIQLTLTTIFTVSLAVLENYCARPNEIKNVVGSTLVLCGPLVFDSIEVIIIVPSCLRWN